MKQLFKKIKNRLLPAQKNQTGRIRHVHRGNCSCPVCGKENISFLPLPMYFFRELHRHQYIHSIFQKETLNIEQYLCPFCNATDRDRLYAVYLSRIFKSGNKICNILDIAPSASLTQYIASLPGAKVRTADLNMPGVDDHVDITDLSLYEDGRFDAFICSHVFEHIPQDIKAMKELYRVLAPGGWGIAMVPVDLSLDVVYENPDITDAAGRWKHFGQFDHVRMYSKSGFVNRLQMAGFAVEQLGVDFFGSQTFCKYGIHERSVLYIVHK